MNEEKIIEIVKSSSEGVDLNGLTSTTVFSDIGIDSLDMFTVILAIQDALGIEIPDSDVDKLNSVNAIVEYLTEKAA